MIIDPNITRWILASVSKYMKDLCRTSNLPSIIIGLDDPTKDYMAATDRGEIRITGPFIKAFGSKQHQFMIPANVKITSRYDGNKNAYNIEGPVGIIVSGMDGGIPVFKFGDGEDDDPSEQIGCFKAEGDIKVIRYGQIDETEKVKEIIIDGRFITEFDDIAE